MAYSTKKQERQRLVELLVSLVKAVRLTKKEAIEATRTALESVKDVQEAANTQTVAGIRIRKERPAPEIMLPVTRVSGIPVFDVPELGIGAKQRPAAPAQTARTRTIAGVRVKDLPDSFYGASGGRTARATAKAMPDSLSGDQPGSLAYEAATTALEDARKAAGCSPELFDVLIRKLGREQTYQYLKSAALGKDNNIQGGQNNGLI